MKSGERRCERCGATLIGQQRKWCSRDCHDRKRFAQAPFLKFCPDCAQGFFCWANQTKRCPICARDRRRRRAKERPTSPRTPQTRAADNARTKRRRAANPELFRARGRAAAEKRRNANPEQYRLQHAVYSKRSRARSLGLTVEEYEARVLMNEATRLAVRELRDQRRAALVARRACGICGTMYIPTRRNYVYCSRECLAQSVRDRSCAVRGR
jgi:hypothetical protein